MELKAGLGGYHKKLEGDEEGGRLIRPNFFLDSFTEIP